MGSSRPFELQRLLTRIAATRVRWRTIDAARRTLLLMSCMVLLGLVALIADRFLQFGSGALLGVDLALVTLWAAYVGWGFVRPLLVPLGDDRVAVHIEQRLGNLDGRLINAVQIGRDPRLADNPFSSVLVRQNCRSLDGVDFAPSVPMRVLRPAVLVCLGSLVLLGIYGSDSPDHLTRSLRRYLSPWHAEPPLTETVIDRVDPGNTVVLSGADVTVRAQISGRAPSRVALRVGTERNWREVGSPALSNEGQFEWLLPRLTRPVDYQVLAGDARSEVYHVNLTAAPGIQSIDVTLVYPEYARKPSETWFRHDGNIEGLTGSTVRIVGHSNKSLRSAELQRTRHEPLPVRIERGSEGDRVMVEWRIEESETCWFHVTDETNHPNVSPVRYAVVAIRDQSPVVQWVGGDDETRQPLTGTPSLRFAASDDYGLVEAVLRLEVTSAFDQMQKELPGMRNEVPGQPREHAGAFEIPLQALKVTEGDVLHCRAEVRDALGQKAVSATRRVLVVRPDAAEDAGKKSRSNALERLQELLVRQTENLGATRALPEVLGAEGAADEVDRVTARQVALRRDAGELADEFPENLSKARDGLRGLVREEMRDAVELLAEVARGRTRSAQRRSALETALVQEEILRKLQQLAFSGKAIVEGTEKPAPDSSAERSAANAQENQKALDAFKDKLTQFYKEQKANVLETQKLLEQPPDSEEAEALSRDVLERQRLARKLAREAADMTKTLAEKEITNPQLLERMEDVFRAVSDAEKAAEMKEHRRMLMKEEMAILMASSIPDNGEAFLGSGGGAKTQWDFEDWPEEERPETQIPPIPPNLHDTLGDLIDAQQQLAEDSDDLQSQMHFGATDNTGLIGGDGGPLSNMMAKGRSGNTTPKNNEVGGRSGSGRTGKSSGEFVEEVDVAKEGRETEDRYTKEQAMKGFVKSVGDKKRAGGSTSSGGKRSDEATEFGLRGDASILQSRQRMKVQEEQDTLRIKMEQFSSRLKEILGRADFDVQAALLLMQEVEADISGGRFEHILQKQAMAIHHLKMLHRRLAAHVGHSEASAEDDRKPDTGRAEREDPLRERYPPEYRRMLQEYYKALSETGTE